MCNDAETRPDGIGARGRPAWILGAVASALFLVATMFVLPATAVVYGGGGGGTAAGGVSTATWSGNGGQPTFSGATSNTIGTPDVTTITMNSALTILHFDTFNLAPEDTLNLSFASNNHRVLIRVARGAADINGTLNALMGGGPGQGGQVTISAPDGIYVGSQARVAVGGLIATTAQTMDLDFFNGMHTFTDSGYGITLSAGAQVKSDLGLLAFIGSRVDQAANIDGAEALYGAADDFSLTFDEYRLQSFTPHEGVPGGQVDLYGTTHGGSVAVSTLSTTAAGGINVSGTVSPDSAPASGYGYTALAAGGGVERGGSFLSAVQPTPKAGAAAQDVIVSGEIVGYGAVSSYSSGKTIVHGKVSHPFGYHPVTLDAVDDLGIGSTGAISSLGLAVTSTDADFVNNSGADGITAGQWIVYSPDREGNTYGGLDSGNTALWGDTLATRPPAQVTGKRYVFASQPTLTFSSLDHSKAYGVEATALPFGVTGIEPAEAGAFKGDTAAAVYSGEPVLSSPGAPAAAPVPVPGTDPYLIDIEGGTLASDVGYLFAFSDTGRLAVTELEPAGTSPVIVPTVSGTLKDNGWYSSDVNVSWSVTDEESGVWSRTGCADAGVSADTTGTTFTCTATSAGGTSSQSVTIKRDTVPPALAPTVSPDPVAHNGSATASPNATDATSGVASSSCERVATDIVGEHTLTCTATDNAGHVTTDTDVPYRVDEAPRRPGAPVIGDASSGTRGRPVTAIARWAAGLRDGGSPITEYKVQAQKLNPSGQVTARVTKSVGPTRTSMVAKLPAGRYKFRVRASNAIGWSAWSDTSNVVKAR